VKFAVTVLGPSITTEHPAIPEQAPVQPENDHPTAGTAVSPTVAPAANGPEQVEPHWMPPGSLVTVPLPVLPTASGNVVCEPARSKMAVTDTESTTSSVQTGLVPSQPPAQPANTEPAAGVALSTTGTPPLSSAGTDA